MSSYGVLDEELITYEILPRLPIKSLFKFKLVCKKWLNLITHDPHFVTNHFQKGPNRINLTSSTFYCLIYESLISSDDQYYQFKLSMNKRHLGQFGCSIMGTTNGLLYGFCCERTKIFICNPITKDVVYIPNPRQRLEMALAYDPYNNPNFGFAIVVAVCPQKHVNPNCSKFEVYWSKTAEWRVSNAELQIPSHKLFRKNHPVSNGGKVYWSLVKHLAWFDVEEDATGLVPICPSQNNIASLHPPICARFTISYIEIGVCNGNGGELSYIKMTQEGDFEIWLLKNKGGNYHEFEWMKRHNVRLQKIVEENWSIVENVCNIMGIRNRNAVAKAFASCRRVYPVPYVGGEVVWFSIHIVDSMKVFSINLRTQELKVIEDHHLPLPFYPFIPTLLPCPT